ncbi:MAG: glycoside hydrolase family 65 protein, partial [Solirubrobacterales bacterium]
MIGQDVYPVQAWSVRETSLDLDLLAQSESIFALANGHLGLRGNLDEGEPRALSGTYLNGFYESRPIAYGESGYGYPEDGQTVVNVTDGKLIRLLVEDEPLDVHRGNLESHERELDFRAGTLTRKLRWTSQAGRTVDVKSTRLVSFRDRNIAAISYEVEAVGEPIRVALQSNLLANQTDSQAGGDPRGGAELGAVLESKVHTHDGLRVVLAHTTRSSGLSLSAGMEHVIDAESEPLTRTECEPDLGRLTISAELTPGKPLRVVKLLAYHWSSQESIEWLRDQVDASLESALAIGFDAFATAQRERLDGFWEVANIELDGDEEIQQALRFALFQIFQASVRAESRAIPAKGLTGPGYDGHAFWDTEGYVLPVLTYSAPQHARDALLWRHSTLEMAKDRAEQLGLKGAAFPWRTIHGEECSGYWPAGTAAFHVNADIADAVQRYIHATGDVEFEGGAGLDLLVETARLWMSLGHHGADGAFHISGVTGPDEYSAIVDDNVYTNLMAERNLREAADAAERHEDDAARLSVDDDEIAAWRNAAAVVHVAFDERLG